MDQMDAMEMVAAIKSIPKKKERLREAFEALQSSVSSLLATSSSTLTLQWKWNWRDVEDHISTVETSVLERFSAAIQQTTTIDSISTTATAEPAATGDDDDKKKNTPNLELLKILCINMDAKGLRACLNANCNNSRGSALFADVSLALGSAPDPALLILDAMDRFQGPRNLPICKTRRARGREILAARKTCIHLLEILYPISLEIGIKPSVRERALSLAMEWKAKLAERKAKVDEANNESWETALQALGFLRLIAAYRLVPEFEADDVMELLCFCISRKCMTADLVESLGLVDKALDLLRPPTFTGSETPLHVEDWLRRMEGMFRVTNVPEEAWIDKIQIWLADIAYNWWQTEQNRLQGQEVTWKTFISIFLEKYFPESERYQMIEQFTTLKQDGRPLEAYVQEYDRLEKFALHLVPTERDRAVKFRNGLDVGIQKFLTSLQLDTLDKMVAAARDHDHLQRQERKIRTVTTKRDLGTVTTKRDLGTYSGEQVPQAEVKIARSTSVLQPSHYRGSIAQVSTPLHRPNRICYNCRKAGHMSKECPFEPVCNHCGLSDHTGITVTTKRDLGTYSGEQVPQAEVKIARSTSVLQPSHYRGSIAQVSTPLHHANRICYNCRKAGHMSKECPFEPVCNHCGLSDHTRIMCPHQGTIINAKRQRTLLPLRGEAHHRRQDNKGAKQGKGHVTEDREPRTQSELRTGAGGA